VLTRSTDEETCTKVDYLDINWFEMADVI